jgi:uncharacterized damage-inducible protein DinB
MATNREFFLKIINEETSKFRKAIEALPPEKHSHKVHDRSREAGSLAAQLALQWKAISGVITKGSPDFDPHEMQNQTKESMLAKFDEGIENLKNAVSEVSDDEWENTDAAMGDVWKDKKGNMAWGFLFDAIHHRGQLTTYLRAMGERVPSIYGPSADEQ